MTADRIWLTIGLLGQALFAGRFVFQWLSSESAGRSVIPIGFWYLSIGGGMTLLAYAVHRGDPVFVLGQLMGVSIYVRNLHLIQRARGGSVTGESRC